MRKGNEYIQVYVSDFLLKIEERVSIINANSSSADLLLGSWGMGEKGDPIFFEETSWSLVYYDMNDLYLQARLPNYQSTQLTNGLASLYGEVGDAGYVITTSFNSGFTPPKSAKKFLKMIQDANSDLVVSEVNPKKFGAKYVVDLTPIDGASTTFWRFLSTEDRLIKMATDDADENRRDYFFDSITIK